MILTSIFNKYTLTLKFKNKNCVMSANVALKLLRVKTLMEINSSPFGNLVLAYIRVSYIRAASEVMLRRFGF